MEITLLFVSVNLLSNQYLKVAFLPEAFANDTEVFFVKSCYATLDLRTSEVLEMTQLRATLRILWKLRASSNIQMFNWRMFLDRLSIRDQLENRGKLVGDRDRCCAFYF